MQTLWRSFQSPHMAWPLLIFPTPSHTASLCSLGSSHSDLIDPPASVLTPASRPPPCCSFCPECFSPRSLQDWLVPLRGYLLAQQLLPLEQSPQAQSRESFLFSLQHFYSLKCPCLFICLLTMSSLTPPGCKIPGFPVHSVITAVEVAIDTWLTFNEHFAIEPCYALFRSFHGSPYFSELRTHSLACQLTVSMVLPNSYAELCPWSSLFIITLNTLNWNDLHGFLSPNLYPSKWGLWTCIVGIIWKFLRTTDSEA